MTDLGDTLTGSIFIITRTSHEDESDSRDGSDTKHSVAGLVRSLKREDWTKLLYYTVAKGKTK